MWFGDFDGRRHEVEIRDRGLRRQLTWRIDDAEVATRTTTDERVVLSDDEDGENGAIGVKLPTFVGSARRVAWFADQGAAHVGLGGTDLTPEAGSRAAAREEWIRAHPHLHTARQTALAAAAILAPLLVAWLLARIPWPSVDLPDIPWPDLPWPDIPWPSIPWPSIPWPDWSLPQLPAWLEPARRFIVPLLIAIVLARMEIRRRRRQDRLRERDARREEDS